MKAVSEPVTRVEMDAALGQLEARINDRIDGLSKELKAEISELLVKLDERADRNLERLETRMTSTFWKWARPREIQQRDDRARLNAADTQLGGLEERVTLIEGRLSDLEFGPHRQPGA